jgi:hypothetical protein
MSIGGDYVPSLPPGIDSKSYLNLLQRTRFQPPQVIVKEAVVWALEQEYQASYELVNEAWGSDHAEVYRESRRPKPRTLSPSEALEEFDALMEEIDGAGDYSICASRIREALRAANFEWVNP